MLRMLDRHAVQELLRAGLTPRAIATQYGVSRRTVERIRHEDTVTAAAVAERRATPLGKRLLLE
jgi:IS30 family transposase